MIRYRLICSQDHEFEAWFRDSTAYDRQLRRHQVTCPHCGDVDVTKAVMAPGLKSTPSEGRGDGPVEGRSEGRGAGATGAEAKAHEVARRILAAVGKLKDQVETDCEYVGERFADEARAIHQGDAEDRGIYGEATAEEADDLIEEGIPVFRLPGGSRRRDN